MISPLLEKCIYNLRSKKPVASKNWIPDFMCPWWILTCFRTLIRQLMQQNIVIYFVISDTFLLEIAFYTVKTIAG